MKALLKMLGLIALAVALLILPAAWGADRAGGRDLLVVEASSEDVVETNRGLWELDGGGKEGVAAIYGTPRGTERLLFVPERKVLVPKEDPSLSIYLKKGDDHPLQAQTLWYFALPTAVGAAVAGVVLLLLSRRHTEPDPDWRRGRE